MKRLKQERTHPGQIFPFPKDGALVEENPPCFAWITPDKKPICTVAVYDNNGCEKWRGSTRNNYIVPDCFFDAGTYRWNLFTEDSERGEQSFIISENAVKIYRVPAGEIYDKIPSVHPRHLFSAEDIDSILKDKSRELEVLRRNIEEAYKDGLPNRPMYHWDEAALPYREYFGRFRDYCDRDMVACALGYALLGDKKAGEHARRLLLTMCDFGTEGPCSIRGPWYDEIGLSLARCLPSVYDLIYSLLSDKERIYVSRIIHAYGKQCMELLKRLDFCENPGSSHAGRIPAYLGEAVFALKDSGIQSREEAEEWLSYVLDIYGGIFPYYGTPDGGWAEGTFYSTSYTKWYLPFFCAVERYSGCRFLDRPFYQRFTQFLLHFASPDFENHPFGDGYWCNSEDKEWPGFFAQNPFRLYADRFGPELARKKSAEAAVQNIYKLHLLDIFIPRGNPPEVSLTGDATNVMSFPEAGFISMHTDINNTAEDIAVMARASHFGSDSHRHPDQGSFALFAGGVAMISPSGYFGRAYGTKHHMEWLNSTRAHNALLIDGIGQKSYSMESVGSIVYCHESEGQKEAQLDLSPAYPMLNKWIRTLILNGCNLTVIDEVEADNPVTVTYPLHTLSLPIQSGNTVIVERKSRTLRITPCSGDLDRCVISDRYAVDINEGEPPEYHVAMPPQFHISWTTSKRCKHYIKVVYTVG